MSEHRITFTIMWDKLKMFHLVELVDHELEPTCSSSYIIYHGRAFLHL